MVEVLVCVKRVPESSGQVQLSEDAQSVDGRYAGYGQSEHDGCAVELGVRLTEPAGGAVTALTLGADEAIEQVRAALAVGATAGVHVRADPVAFGPADVAREIAAVVRAHQDLGRAYDVILLGNDAADTGDFQVPVRLAYELDRPVLTGIKRATVAQGRVRAQGDSPDGGVEEYDVALPVVIAVLEGGVDPRYPTMKGRMAARKVEVEEREPSTAPAGASRVRLTLPPPAPSQVQVIGEGPAAAGPLVDLFGSLGVL